MDTKVQSGNSPLNWMGTLLGAAAGGAVGYFAFSWLAQQGFYAVALPGVLLGIAAGRFSRARSWLLAVVCGTSGLALGLFAEWKHFPFVQDPSFGYFLAHLQDLRPVSWIMLLLGGIAGAYFCWSGAARRVPPAPPEPSPR